MKTSIPWLRVFIEGVVIVGSILLAFGIDAWWEGRQERNEERELLADLHAEFGVTRGLLEASIRGHGGILRVATALSSPGASQVSLPVSAQIPGLGPTALAALGSPSDAQPYQVTEVTDEAHDQMIRFHSSELGRSYSSDRAIWEWFAVRDGEILLAELDEIIRALESAIGG